MAMALLFIASLPISAFAETFYLDDGSIEITATAVENSADTNYAVKQYDYAAQDWVAKDDTTDAPVITQRNSETPTTKTVTINATDANTTAKVTLSGVNIDTSGTAVSTAGEGSVVVELDGNNIIKSGTGAGLEMNNGGGLTITDANNDGGKLEAMGGSGGAGIGVGENASEVSDITINGCTVIAKGDAGAAGIGGNKGNSVRNVNIDNANVYAEGGKWAAGIGGGVYGKLTGAVVISGEAKVVSVAGEEYSEDDKVYSGAAIGDGICVDEENDKIIDGKEATLDTSKLIGSGFVKLTAKDITRIITPETKEESKTASQTASPAVKLYNVVDKDGKDISYTAEVKDGVLTITVDADYAALTGTLAGMSALTAQGVESISFVTNGATSTFDLADLSAKGSGTYKLTHDGATVTFTLGTTDISEILK